MNESERLTAMLAQPARAGVYHLPLEGIEGVSKAAAELGFIALRIDLDGCADKAEFLRRVAGGLKFPTWFGHNWDALSDCMTDLSWLPGDGYVLILEHADHFRVVAEDEFVTALDIFEDAARTWEEAGIPMWVLVDLARDGITYLRGL